jgi:hypothetical protein
MFPSIENSEVVLMVLGITVRSVKKSIQLLNASASMALPKQTTTGKVRGLLCLHCNIMIGMAKENQETLKAAIQYLEDNKNDL